MSLTAVLRRMGRGGLTVHGFRSSFRDWAGELTPHPREVIEAALAHRLKDKAEAAYARGDLFAKRRRLMADWAGFCTTTTPAGEVVPLRARRACLTSCGTRARLSCGGSSPAGSARGEPGRCTRWPMLIAFCAREDRPLPSWASHGALAAIAAQLAAPAIGRLGRHASREAGHRSDMLHYERWEPGSGAAGSGRRAAGHRLHAGRKIRGRGPAPGHGRGRLGRDHQAQLSARRARHGRGAGRPVLPPVRVEPWAPSFR